MICPRRSSLSLGSHRQLGVLERERTPPAHYAQGAVTPYFSAYSSNSFFAHKAYAAKRTAKRRRRLQAWRRRVILQTYVARQAATQARPSAGLVCQLTDGPDASRACM